MHPKKNWLCLVIDCWQEKRQKVRLFRTIALILLCFASLFFAFVAQAGSSNITLEVIPDMIELLPEGKGAQILVIVRNSTQDTLYDLQPVFFSNAAHAATAQPIKSLAQGEQHAWTLNIFQSMGELTSGKAVIYIHYTRGSQVDNSKTPGVLSSSIQIRKQELSATQQIAEIQVKTALESLSEKRPGVAYIIITNKSTGEIQLEKISPTGPNFICFGKTCNSTKESEIFPAIIQTVSPNRTEFIPIDINVIDRVQPGKYMLLFNTVITWKEVENRTGSILTTQEVNIGVFGESEILTVLGVPSFLMLPGFLMLTTLSLLWESKLIRVEKKYREFNNPLGVLDSLIIHIIPQLRQLRILSSNYQIGEFSSKLKPNQAEFWMISITTSGLFALICFGITGQDYLERYKLQDVITIWLISVFLLGGGLYLLLVLLEGWNQRYQQWLDPDPSDDCITTLRKLDRRHLGIFCERVRVVDHGQNVVLINPYKEDEPDAWIAPPIIVKRAKNLTDKNKETIPQARNNIVAAILEGNAGKLANILQEGERNKVINVEWEQIQWEGEMNLRGPHKVKNNLEISFHNQPMVSLSDEML